MTGLGFTSTWSLLLPEPVADLIFESDLNNNRSVMKPTIRIMKGAVVLEFFFIVLVLSFGKIQGRFTQISKQNEFYCPNL